MLLLLLEAFVPFLLLVHITIVDVDATLPLIPAAIPPIMAESVRLTPKLFIFTILSHQNLLQMLIVVFPFRVSVRNSTVLLEEVLEQSFSVALEIAAHQT